MLPSIWEALLYHSTVSDSVLSLSKIASDCCERCGLEIEIEIEADWMVWTCWHGSSCVEVGRGCEAFSGEIQRASVERGVAAAEEIVSWARHRQSWTGHDECATQEMEARGYEVTAAAARRIR